MTGTPHPLEHRLNRDTPSFLSCLWGKKDDLPNFFCSQNILGDCMSSKGAKEQFILREFTVNYLANIALFHSELARSCFWSLLVHTQLRLHVNARVAFVAVWFKSSSLQACRWLCGCMALRFQAALESVLKGDELVSLRVQHNEELGDATSLSPWP